MIISTVQHRPKNKKKKDIRACILQYITDNKKQKQIGDANGNGSENFLKGLGILSQYKCTTDNNKIICRTASSVMTRKIFKKDCTCKYHTYEVNSKSN
jgi:hypothetical protein